MPWKTSTPVDLRREFMERVLRGERVTDLCREFGISRKTGDKLKQRYKRMGEAGLEDGRRGPKVIPHRTPPEVEALLVAEKKLHPTWGAKKLKSVLEERLERTFPALSTINDLLSRHDLVKRRKNRGRDRASPTPLRAATAPNELGCIDYKGQFRLGDRSYCYPLTITDQFSRYLLTCEGMGAISEAEARETCVDTFRRYGLPVAIRSDNGTPFASTGLAGLTSLSVFWMRLGIECERIRPSHPEENGRHERMHRTLKAETARPARSNLLQQQERFDEFTEEFNNVRPHEALGLRPPSKVYQRSPRDYPRELPEPDYPTHDDVLQVATCGGIRLHRQRYHLTAALRGQLVGIRERKDGSWLVSFMKLDLAVLGRDGRTLSLSRSAPPNPA